MFFISNLQNSRKTVAALLVVLPLGVALPTFIGQQGQVVWTGRSYQEDDEYEVIPGEEYPDDLNWENSYEQELGLLQVYFAYLKVSDTLVLIFFINRLTVVMKYQF